MVLLKGLILHPKVFTVHTLPHTALFFLYRPHHEILSIWALAVRTVRGTLYLFPDGWRCQGGPADPHCLPGLKRAHWASWTCPAVSCPDIACVLACGQTSPPEAPRYAQNACVCVCVWSRPPVYSCVCRHKREFVQRQRELRRHNVSVMLNWWNGSDLHAHMSQGWVTKIARHSPPWFCIPHYAVVSGHFRTSDKAVNQTRMQTTTATKEQEHIGCFETLPVQTWLWSAAAVRAHCMPPSLSLPLSLLSSPLQFFWPTRWIPVVRVCKHERGEELWAAARARRGMPGRAGGGRERERERERERKLFDNQPTTQLDALLFMKM